MKKTTKTKKPTKTGKKLLLDVKRVRNLTADQAAEVAGGRICYPNTNRPTI